jgi:hypothetical protein
MARHTLSALAAILAALGVSSLALVAAAPANKAVAGNDALALVSPQGESTYKAAQAEGLGNVVMTAGENAQAATAPR